IPLPKSDFSRYLENLSLNLSPKRRETLNFTSFPVSDWERPSLRLRLPDSLHRNEQHFQPLAVKEVLKGFHLKLTPMSIAVSLRQM
ncbi:MAG: hypothetical protein ACYTXY_48550, partial [Nostoc sp.]